MLNGNAQSLRPKGSRNIKTTLIWREGNYHYKFVPSNRSTSHSGFKFPNVYSHTADKRKKKSSARQVDLHHDSAPYTPSKEMAVLECIMYLHDLASWNLLNSFQLEILKEFQFESHEDIESSVTTVLKGHLKNGSIGCIV